MGDSLVASSQTEGTIANAATGRRLARAPRAPPPTTDPVRSRCGSDRPRPSSRRPAHRRRAVAATSDRQEARDLIHSPTGAHRASPPTHRRAPTRLRLVVGLAIAGSITGSLAVVSGAGA